MNQIQSTSPAATTRSSRRVRLIAVAAAVLATGLIWVAAKIVGTELKVDPGNGQPITVIGLGSIVVVTLLVSLLGWGSLALLERITRRGPAIWVALSVLVLLVSLVPVLWVGAPGSVKVMLGLMHVAVAAVLIPAFIRSSTAKANN